MAARKGVQMVDVTTRHPNDVIDPSHARRVETLTITVDASWINVAHDGRSLGCFSTIAEAASAIEEWLAAANPTLAMRTP